MPTFGVDLPIEKLACSDTSNHVSGATVDSNVVARWELVGWGVGQLKVGIGDVGESSGSVVREAAHFVTGVVVVKRVASERFRVLA